VIFSVNFHLKLIFGLKSFYSFQESQRRESWEKPIQGLKTGGWQKTVLTVGCEFSSGSFHVGGDEDGHGY